VLLGVFRLVPLAVTVKGVPLKAANSPLICQSLTIDFAMLPKPSIDVIGRMGLMFPCGATYTLSCEK
jgi:hypothetical protein